VPPEEKEPVWGENPLIGVYYYPYYPTPKDETWRGGDRYSEEWALMRQARARFDDHLIRRPSHSDEYPPYADASKTDVMERQIDLAVEHGIDLFIFNWYFDNLGREYLSRPIQAFLHARNRRHLRFAVNWCFSLPKRKLPEEWRGGKDRAWRAVTLSPQYLEDGMTYCCRHFFSQDNYWHHGGRPVVYMFNIKTLWEQPGMSPARWRTMLDAGRAAAGAAGEANPFCVGIIPSPEERCIEIAAQSPWDAATGYVYLPEFVSNRHIQNYQELILRRLEDWRRFRTIFHFPWLPSLAAGWDATPRGTQKVRWIEITQSPKTIYPWSPVVTGVDPARFRNWLDEAGRYLVDAAIRPQVINIASWNEWTEGNAIEPSDLFGRAFLEQISDFSSELKRRVPKGDSEGRRGRAFESS
jgi:hypothetical protein